jgi:predicted house-cleaning noncanonical NTP pyrophosphatase (MazG superfamily)
MEKLVRNMVPALMRQVGENPALRTATEAWDRHQLLRAKLLEEVGEFLETDDHRELADILEVLVTMAQEWGLNLEALREAKTRNRGDFSDWQVWMGHQ